MVLEKNLRWFGPDDPVSLSQIRQTGVEGVVTALHNIPNGHIWELIDILKRKELIEEAGMKWHVVESLPVTDAIKTGRYPRDKHIENYKKSIVNLSECGIDTICYNFMPVLDWARTSLNYKTENGGESMLFDYPTFAAFDIFILKRPGAEEDYPATIIKLAEDILMNMSDDQAELLAYNIIVKTQGFIDGGIKEGTTDYKAEFLDYLDSYKGIDQTSLRSNLAYFLDEIIPLAEERGVNMAIHADDPAFPLLGLPRIVSTNDDLDWIFNHQDSINNGLTFCTGSFSSNEKNDLLKMVEKHAGRVHFAHLRNTQLLENGSFFESGHLQGSVDMFAIIKKLLEEQKARMRNGRSDTRIPIRPDHGIKILQDFDMDAFPGYPLIGRLKGLAEITGIEEGIIHSLDL